MQRALISILIPFKNTERFLEECLRSIQKQSYTNWELHIVDDHSSDRSTEIVESYANNDARIHLHFNSGNGIIEALKTAYKHAKGTFITRMDSDDIMTTNKLEQMQQNLQIYGVGHLALGQVKYFSKTGIGAGYKRYETWLNTLTANGSNFEEIYKECVIPSPCWMVYKTDFESCGGFNSDIYPEDYDLAFRFYKHGLKCIPSNDVLHYWRDYAVRTSRVDAHYAENSFLDLKVNYFLELSRVNAQQLILWGAGAKGKKVAQLLLERKIAFEWVCDNPKKIGKAIYGQVLKSFNYLDTLHNFQSIICVANPEAQVEIEAYFKSREMAAMHDYFFFC
jgi:glycosyltransferase involved in cell wall biosynthesis